MVLEYSPYTTPLSAVIKTANRIIREERVMSLAREIIENQKLTRDFPEDLRKVIHTARIKELVEKGKGINYLAGKLKRKRIVFVRLLRLIDVNKLFHREEAEREIMEIPEPYYLKVCMDYYRKPFFDFQSLNPVRKVKVNRKNKSMYLQIPGSCTGCYSTSRRSRRSEITVNNTVMVPEDFPGVLIIFRYSVYRKYYHCRYGSRSSCYSRLYGIVYNHPAGDVISFRFRNNIHPATPENIRTIKELLKLLPPDEKRKIKTWMKSCKNQITKSSFFQVKKACSRKKCLAHRGRVL